MKGLAIFFCIFIVLALFLSFAEWEYDEEMWNGGVCPDCGSRWEFNGATHYSSGNHYCYSCKECGSVIELYHLMK